MLSSDPILDFLFGSDTSTIAIKYKRGKIWTIFSCSQWLLPSHPHKTSQLRPVFGFLTPSFLAFYLLPSTFIVMLVGFHVDTTYLPVLYLVCPRIASLI
jgi:hypothetical protein